MDRLTMARVAISITGLAIWGYGYATDNGGVRMAAIVILAIGLLLRFLRKRPEGDENATK